jgi:hypothetical protein
MSPRFVGSKNKPADEHGKISAVCADFNECVQKREQIIFSSHREYSVCVLRDH